MEKHLNGIIMRDLLYPLLPINAITHQFQPCQFNTSIGQSHAGRFARRQQVERFRADHTSQLQLSMDKWGQRLFCGP
jgi:hypothetical protein